MYESFFDMERRPFLPTPNPGCCAGTNSIQNAFAELERCLSGGQGIAILTAPAGMGKTLLCQALVEHFKNSFATVFLPNSHFATRRSLLQAILHELSQPYVGLNEQELRLAFGDVGKQLAKDHRGIVLIVDEAHLLSERLLEEIRTSTNLLAEGTPLVRVMLSGQLELEEKLTSPALKAFNQRIRCQSTLEPLNRQESAQYIEFYLNYAGVKISDIFSATAVETICHVSDGMPRCINQLCDHSLLLAFVAEEKPVSDATVREALEDLKQLPLHWNEPLPAKSPMEQIGEQSQSVTQTICEETEESLSFAEPSEQTEMADDPWNNSQDGSEIDDFDVSSMTSIEVGATESDDVLEDGHMGQDDHTADDHTADDHTADDHTADDRVAFESFDSDAGAAFEVGAAETNDIQACEPDSAAVDYCVPCGDGWLPSEESTQKSDCLSDNPVFEESSPSVDEFVASDFEEETVLDHYATLEAQYLIEDAAILDPPEQQAYGDQFATDELTTTADLADAQADFEFCEQVDAPSEPSPHESNEFETSHSDGVDFEAGPVELIDQILPLLKEALSDSDFSDPACFAEIGSNVVLDSHSTDDVPDDSPLLEGPASVTAWQCAPDELQSAPQIVRSATELDVQAIEDEIGKSVLDTCLEIQQAIRNRVDHITALPREAGFLPSSEEDGSLEQSEPIENVNFDVIQPESEDSESNDGVVGKTSDFESDAEERIVESHENTRRQFDRLFTELRCRQRRSA